ncbi:hypothetical protein TNCV_4193921 [Trichonephila clavipes]|uniref:Uncharacterized protein n=1 Tax=Trichonephila inaurata madagascariensis TaxID=2747483 RepID=A0A8X6XT88_9ARAC|nr:hypothetical protein TNCV_4193921 [Trichonephila clavipes]GFY57161.1 hypothetical protein TNIN_470271 [Trichonephila inaurata madagascariensis]
MVYPPFSIYHKPASFPPELRPNQDAPPIDGLVEESKAFLHSIPGLTRHFDLILPEVLIDPYTNSSSFLSIFFIYSLVALGISGNLLFRGILELFHEGCAKIDGHL